MEDACHFENKKSPFTENVEQKYWHW